MASAERKAAERRTPTVPRVLQAVTTESKPKQPHATGMEERTADMLLQSQRIHLLSGNYPQAIMTAVWRIEEHLSIDTGDLLGVPLSALRLPESILGPLEAEGVLTVADTLTLSDLQLLGIVRFGKHGLRELRATVREFLRQSTLNLAKGVAN